MIFYALLNFSFPWRFSFNHVQFVLQDEAASVSGQPLPMVNVNTGRNNVLNRVTNQQDKWKRQVSLSIEVLRCQFFLKIDFIA
jgi:hypothetical protein